MTQSQPREWGKNILEGNNFNPERRMSLITSQIEKSGTMKKAIGGEVRGRQG